MRGNGKLFQRWGATSEPPSIILAYTAYTIIQRYLEMNAHGGI